MCAEIFCLATPTFWPYVLLNYCVLQLFHGIEKACAYIRALLLILEL